MTEEHHTQPYRPFEGENLVAYEKTSTLGMHVWKTMYCRAVSAVCWDELAGLRRWIP